jgi:hypothetical protein
VPTRNPCLPCFLLAGNPARRRRSSRLPDPGTLAQLGTLQELQIIRDRDGQEEVHGFGGRFSGDGPPLFWSPKLRTLLVLPRRKPKVWKDLKPLSKKEADALFKAVGAQAAVKLFRRWSMHEPSALSNVKVQDYLLRPTGSMVHIVYRSDKFSPNRTLEDYIHKMPKSDRIAIAGRTVHGVPQAIAIWGPRLTVTERGIVY